MVRGLGALSASRRTFLRVIRRTRIETQRWIQTAKPIDFDRYFAAKNSLAQGRPGVPVNLW
jgi:hypothetical protein